MFHLLSAFLSYFLCGPNKNPQIPPSQTKKLVEKFEADENEEFPALAKQREQLWKTYRMNYAKWEREAADARKNDDVPPPEPSPPQFDAGDPEPKHTMFNPGKHMNGREVRDILDKMKQLAKKTKGRLKIDAEHVLVVVASWYWHL